MERATAGGVTRPKAHLRRNPAWAAGAVIAVEALLRKTTDGLRVLECGLGGATLFLLRKGAAVTAISDADEAAEDIRRIAADKARADRLTIVRGAAPWRETIDRIEPGARFDLCILDAADPEGSLEAAMPYLGPDASILLAPAGETEPTLLAPFEATFHFDEHEATAIWTRGAAPLANTFVPKWRSGHEPVTPADPATAFLPAEFLDGRAIDPGHVSRLGIHGLAATEARLQHLRLIETQAIYVAPRLRSLEGASLRIEAGHKLLTHRGTLFEERTGNYLPTDRWQPFTGETPLAGHTLDLTASGAGRYSFFVLDLIPKLAVLRAAGLTLRDFDGVIVNSGAQWVRDILAVALAGQETAVHAFSTRTPSFRLERSTHIDGIRAARFTPRWVHAYLHEIFGAAAPSDAETFGAFVYISRQRAEGRRIINHDAFLDLIRRYGFREIFAEDHSPAELAVRLRDARVVLSPHGAGLANIIFCPASTRVLELFSSHFTPQYFHLARDIGQPYTALPCTDEDGLNVFDRYEATSTNKAQFNRKDIVVPIDALATLLADVCGPLPERVAPPRAGLAGALARLVSRRG